MLSITSLPDYSMLKISTGIDSMFCKTFRHYSFLIMLNNNITQKPDNITNHTQQIEHSQALLSIYIQCSVCTTLITEQTMLFYLKVLINNIYKGVWCTFVKLLFTFTIFYTNTIIINEKLIQQLSRFTSIIEVKQY